MASDLLSTIRDEIDQRLSELRPSLAEYAQLLGATGALDATARKQAARTQTAPTTRARRKTRVGATRRGSAADVIERATAGPKEEDGKHDADPVSRPQPASAQAATTPRQRATRPKLGRAARGVAREAILGALEHGSHTVGELAVVTAMSGPNINGNLRRLALEGVVVKTKREGKMAWSLAEAIA